MSYLSIDSFKYGMDRRRERVAGTPGTLWLAKNVHVTRGGDIEGVKRFVPVFTLPAGTHGLAALRRQLYTFGSADLAATVPIGVNYQRLQAPGTPAMDSIRDVLGFAGKLYAIADYVDGGRYHFYNGTRVADWDVVAADSADFTALAQLLAIKIGADAAVTAEGSANVIVIKARTAGTPFTCTSGAVNGSGTNDQTCVTSTAQATVVPVTEVLSTADIMVEGDGFEGSNSLLSSLTIDGVELLMKPVAWVAGASTTAIKIQQAISSNSGASGYSASVTDAIVTVSALAGTGAAPNGRELAATTSGGMSLSTDDALAGGVSAVAAVQQITHVTLGGTFDTDDTFTVTVNGTAYKATGLASGTGTSLYVSFQRVWSTAGSLLRYCKLTDATVWNPSGSDAGAINVALDADGNENLVAAASYQNLAAVYGEQAIVLYQLDTDPANFAKSTVLENTYTNAPHSVIKYGNSDTFHLDPTGVRSMQARANTNAPFVSDVGNAIDTYVAANLDTLTEKQRRAAISAIEPRDGRLMVAVGPKIYVLSYFPGAKISAWSYYEPGFEVEAFAKIGNRLYVRSGNTVYLYGGENGNEYPGDEETPSEVEFPFLSGNEPATPKMLAAVDFALTNEWDVTIALDPNREDKVLRVGKVRKTTFNLGSIGLPGESSMVAPRMVCDRAGRRTISMSQIHYTKEKAS